MARNVEVVGGERQVNLLDPLPRPLPPPENGLLGTQQNPEVTALPNGNFVVVYTNDASGSDSDILAIEFTAAGTVVGNVFRVDFDPSGDQFQPDVSPILSGGYAVAIRDEGADGNNNNSLSLVLVPPGSLPDPPEFTVEDLTGNLSLSDPSIATFANGSYIVAYDLFENLADDNFDTRFAIVNAAGNALLTAPTPLSQSGADEFDTAVATFGNIAAVVYDSEELGGNLSDDIVLKIVNSSGVVLDTEIINTAGELFNPEVAALVDGRFVLIWHDFTTTDAYGQIYDPVAGTFSGPAFVISDRGGFQVSPRVAALPDGGFFATWEDYSGSFGDNNAAVNGRRFDANGIPVGDEFRISTSILNNQLDPGLASNDAGILFTVWSNFNTVNTTDDDPFGIQGQFLQPVTEQIIGTAGNDTIQTYGLSEHITALAGDDTIHAGGGEDVIDAGKGNDRLHGQAGGDLLIGGLGKDQQFGGRDADRFDFNKLAESKAGSDFRDILKGFRHSDGDRIDLNDIDADTNASPGNQKFTFIGAGAFSWTDGELRFENGMVQADTNGDGIADFEITVKTGGVPLVAGDFVL